MNLPVLHMNKSIHRLIFLLGGTLLLTGVLLKILHWPGYMISFLVGYGIIGFVFAPIYFYHKLKNHTNKLLRSLDYIGLFCLVTISIGSFLNILEFEIGQYIALAGFAILVILFVPVLLWVIIKNKENRLKRILVLGFSLLYFLWTSYALLTIYINKSGLVQSFIMADQEIPDSNTLKEQLQEKYHDLLEKHPDKNKILLLAQKSDSIKKYIETFKVRLVNQASINDSTIHDNESITMSASELKGLIDNYRIFIRNNFGAFISNELLEKHLLTKVNDPSKTWEDEHFNNLPLIAMITILSKMESDVMYVENELIGNLKNR